MSHTSNSKSNDSSDLSHVANHTSAKRTHKLDDDLTKGLYEMRITENAALSTQEISEWCLVGGE